MSRLDEVLDAVYHKDLPALGALTPDDVRLVDPDGRTPLMHAILAEHPDLAVVRGLIERGSDVNAADAGQAWTALHFAARDQSEAIVSALLDAGAVVDPVDVFGNTPLWRAVDHPSPNLSLVANLLAHGADPRRKSRHGVSPLDVARIVGNPDVLAALEESPHS